VVVTVVRPGGACLNDASNSCITLYIASEASCQNVPVHFGADTDLEWKKNFQGRQTTGLLQNDQLLWISTYRWISMKFSELISAGTTNSRIRLLKFPGLSGSKSDPDPRCGSLRIRAGRGNNNNKIMKWI